MRVSDEEASWFLSYVTDLQCLTLHIVYYSFSRLLRNIFWNNSTFSQNWTHILKTTFTSVQPSNFQVKVKLWLSDDTKAVKNTRYMTATRGNILKHLYQKVFFPWNWYFRAINICRHAVYPYRNKLSRDIQNNRPTNVTLMISAHIFKCFLSSMQMHANSQIDKRCSGTVEKMT